MDENTVEVLRVLIAAIFGLCGFAILVWGMVKHGDGPKLSRFNPMWKHTTVVDYGDPCDCDEDWEEERQELRDRLAVALWEKRRLLRQVKTVRNVAFHWRNRAEAKCQCSPLDDAAEWKIDELGKQVEEFTNG